MARPELIVMLTWNDKTVENAKELFLESKDAPAKFWGCKREGISEERLRDLITTMRNAGKETFLETVAIDEEHCLDTARIAAECGADHLLGTVYFDSVQKVCDEAGMTYSPFFGLDPADTRLRGTVEDIVADAKRVETQNIWGLSFSGFRYVSGDPAELIRAVCNAVEKPPTLMGASTAMSAWMCSKKYRTFSALQSAGPSSRKSSVRPSRNRSRLCTITC